MISKEVNKFIKILIDIQEKYDVDYAGAGKEEIMEEAIKEYEKQQND